MTYLTRRAFLRNAAMLAALGLAGCGSAPTATPIPTAPPSPTPATRPSPPAAIALPTPTAAAPPTSPPVAPTPTDATTATGAPSPLPSPEAAPHMVVAHGASPASITRAAIAAMGGMGRFVKPGHDVIIKPNICSAAYSFEYAATTNPEVVATLVTLCKEAGAKRVRVMDSPFQGTDGEAYTRSGIEEAVKKVGGEMEFMSRMRFQNTPIPKGRDIKSWPVYQEVLKADVVINVPIAKNHGIAVLTLGMKNLMGVILDRGSIHINIGQRLADLYSLIRPTLTVIDAVRIMTRGGPTGGSLSYVRKLDTVVVSQDVVAADAYAATFFGMRGADLGYVSAGAEMGLGRMDIENLRIERIEA